jgi:hypothetical protein
MAPYSYSQLSRLNFRWLLQGARAIRGLKLRYQSLLDLVHAPKTVIDFIDIHRLNVDEATTYLILIQTSSLHFTFAVYSIDLPLPTIFSSLRLLSTKKGPAGP